MDVAEVLPLDLELELPEGLDEGHALDVTYGAAQLGTQMGHGLSLLPVTLPLPSQQKTIMLHTAL